MPDGVRSKRALYREALTPLLHRRFAHGAGLLLLVCFVESVLVTGQPLRFWTWFPIGPAGIRTLLLFIAGLAIFVMRVANIHFGTRTSSSEFIGLLSYICRRKTLFIIGAYIFSAFWFSEVYVWSAPNDASLKWVEEGKSYEPTRLNERPIYLRSHYLLLALYQTAYHIIYDLDRIPLLLDHSFPAKPGSSAQVLPISPQQHVIARAPALLKASAKRASFLSITNLAVYALLLRQRAWDWSLSLGRITWNIPTGAEPPTIPPYHYTLIVRSAYSGLLLVGLWDLSNLVFESHVAQGPLKLDKPLTDSSKDPNGSLMNGLSSRREIVRTFAFWELLVIARGSAERRRALFGDLDRKGGSTWEQIMKSSLDVLEDIHVRITDNKAPPPEMTLAESDDITTRELPRLSAPLQQGNIFSTVSKAISRRERYSSRAGAIARYYGESPSTESPLLNLSTSVRDRVFTEEQQRLLTTNNISDKLLEWLRAGLRYQIGAPFRHTFASRSRTKVLGTPTSELEVILCAMDSIACLARSSLEDDQYGIVYKTVPLIIRTFVNIMDSINNFTRESPIHWSDVAFQEASGQGRRVDEIVVIQEHLGGNIALLLASFEPYAADMGLSAVEIREARRAATSSNS